jgi:hypothetical protein
MLTDAHVALISILHDHYQKTYELTFELWKQRNRIFLLLLGTVAVAALVTFRLPDANSLLVNWIAEATGTPESEKSALRDSLSIGVVNLSILVAIFYLMVNLYHRAGYVLQNYRYLGLLEAQIRSQIGDIGNNVAFTREGTFYWQERERLRNTVKYAYILSLGVLLLAAISGRIYDDLSILGVFHSTSDIFAIQRLNDKTYISSWLLLLADILISTLIITYFVAYASSSISLEQLQQREFKPSESETQVPDERTGSNSTVVQP